MVVRSHEKRGAEAASIMPPGPPLNSLRINEGVNDDGYYRRI